MLIVLLGVFLVKLSTYFFIPTLFQKILCPYYYTKIKAVIVNPYSSLHSFWDDILLTIITKKYVFKLMGGKLYILSFEKAITIIVLVILLTIIFSLIFYKFSGVDNPMGLNSPTTSKFYIFLRNFIFTPIGNKQNSKSFFLAKLTLIKSFFKKVLTIFTIKIRTVVLRNKVWKYRLWRPLFKKLSYFGLFMSARNKFFKK